MVEDHIMVEGHIVGVRDSRAVRAGLVEYDGQCSAISACNEIAPPYATLATPPSRPRKLSHPTRCDQRGARFGEASCEVQ